MRCRCCNAPFDPSIIKSKDGKVIFEDMCSSCRSKVNPTTYAPEWEHADICDRPIELYE